MPPPAASSTNFLSLNDMFFGTASLVVAVCAAAGLAAVKGSAAQAAMSAVAISAWGLAARRYEVSMLPPGKLILVQNAQCLDQVVIALHTLHLLLNDAVYVGGQWLLQRLAVGRYSAVLAAFALGKN